jgi:hypothetical protein
MILFQVRRLAGVEALALDPEFLRVVGVVAGVEDNVGVINCPPELRRRAVGMVAEVTPD